MRRRLGILLSVIAWTAAPAHAATPSTTLVDVTSSGAQATGGGSDGAMVSPDGRYVVFDSTATNLAPAATSGSRQVYLRDRRTLQTTLLSDPAKAAMMPQLSANGNAIAYLSTDAAGYRWYVYDIAAGTTKPVPGPTALGGSCATGFGYGSVSADGSAVAYCASSDIYLSSGGVARKVTQLPNGTALNGSSFDAVVSGDGQWVAFTTNATNWTVPADGDGYRDVLLWHAGDGSFTNVSVGNGGAAPNLHSSTPAVDANGCHVAFYSDATNLIAGDDGTMNKTFVRDRCGGTTDLASITSGGAEATSTGSALNAISGDGCRVAFTSTQAVGGASAGAMVLRDLCNGLTQRLDLASSGEGGNGAASQGSISGGTGRYVAFTSAATNLAAADANGTTKDVFVRDLATNTPPIAKLALSQTGASVLADATASSDPDGYVLTGRVAFGDGTDAVGGLQATHAYARGGTYTVSSTVTDADGASTTTSTPVTVPSPPGVAAPPQALPPATTPPQTTPAPAGLTLDKVTLSRTRFALRGKGKGARLTLRLSAAATVKLSFAKAKRTRHRTRYVPGKVLTRRLPAGTSSVAVGTGLTPGSYRVTVSARTAAGVAARSRTLRFTATKGKR